MKRIFTRLNGLLVLMLAITVFQSCKKNNDVPIIPVVPVDYTAPRITEVKDPYGAPNYSVLIYGHNFSQNPKDNIVKFGDLQGVVVTGDSTSFIVNVPDSAPVGLVPLTITVNNKTVTFSQKFNVTAPNPQLNALSVPSGMRGGKLFISGKDFSTVPSGNKVTINGINTIVDSASIGSLWVTIPANATSGKVVLTTHGTTLTSTTDLNILTETVTKFCNGLLTNLSFDAKGNLYGTKPNTNTVIKVDPSGTTAVLATIGSAYTKLGGCVADANGNVYVTAVGDYDDKNQYVSSANAYKIYKVSPAGVVSVLAGSDNGYIDAQGTAAKFKSPTNLAIDVSGNIYVNDASVVRKINPAGAVTTIAGNYDTFAMAKDGQGTSAHFTNIVGLTVDKSNNIFVSDISAGRIRKITPDGTVTTLAVTPDSTAPGSVSTSYPNIGNANLQTDAAGNLFFNDLIFIFRLKDNIAYNTWFNPLAFGANLYGMTLDAAGNLYVSASGGVYKISR